mgnify:CR=1 FL=1
MDGQRHAFGHTQVHRRWHGSGRYVRRSLIPCKPALLEHTAALICLVRANILFFPPPDPMADDVRGVDTAAAVGVQLVEQRIDLPTGGPKSNQCGSQDALSTANQHANQHMNQYAIASRID